MAHHALVLTHAPLWLASCSCQQWTGVPRRHAKDAVRQQRAHQRSVRSTSCGTWRRPTPVSDLPESLRCTA